MEIILAKSAGMCAGVLKALKTVYGKASHEKLYSYGPLTHNKKVISDLEKKGVSIINEINEDIDGTVVLRTHGVAPEIYKTLEEKNIKYSDCTCVDVKRIHRIANENWLQGKRIIIIGDREHPEVFGIMGFAGDSTIVLDDEEHLQNIELDKAYKYALVVQTTFVKEKFEEITRALQKYDLDITIYDTICKATTNRQQEAAELSKNVDYMIVIGDKLSSNTTKLYEICKKYCKKTYLIETIRDLQLNIFNTNDKIGITAGASTPPDIIKEAFITMSETASNKNNQSFEEMLNESFVTLHTGNVVKGTVINVSNGEVFVNLGYKSDGIIPRGEFSEDPTIEPSEVVASGDEIEVFVVRVNDGDGNVLLSKKKIDSQRNYDELEQAFNNNTSVKGKVIDIVKGGLIAIVNGVRVFVPSSQISNRYVEELGQFKGKEFNFNIIEFDKSKRRFVAGRKHLAAQELKEKKEKVFTSLEVGKQVEGTVSRIVDFGAFIDLGGVDGLIHISELSWGRVKKVKDVLSEGQKVLVTVLEIDKEKGKISLSLKDIKNDPWLGVTEKYPVGDIVSGKIVRMVPFGAFVELEEGVDGLIHISQISSKHVVKPEDELKIGQVVEAKVTEIDVQAKRISLSKKEADGIGAAPEAEEPAIEE